MGDRLQESSMASLRLKKVLGEVFLLDPGKAKGKVVVQQHVGGVLQQGLVLLLLLPSSSFLSLLSSLLALISLFLLCSFPGGENEGYGESWWCWCVWVRC
jgi:hypothetical protein